jgi:hypothetical protein
MALLAVAFSLVPMAACGSSGKTDDSSPSPSAGASGLGAVLIVVPDQDLSDPGFWQLRDSLAGAGYVPVVASQSGGDIEGSDGTTIKTDLAIPDADARDYVGLAIIGVSSAALDDPALLALVRSAVAADEVVGRCSRRGRQTIVVEGKALPDDSPFLTLDFASDFVDALSFSRYGGTVVSPGPTPAPSGP